MNSGTSDHDVAPFTSSVLYLLIAVMIMPAYQGVEKSQWEKLLAQVSGYLDLVVGLRVLAWVLDEITT